MNVVVELTQEEADEIRTAAWGGGNWVTADGQRAMIRRELLMKIVGDGDPRRRTYPCEYDGLQWSSAERLGQHMFKDHHIGVLSSSAKATP